MTVPNPSPAYQAGYKAATEKIANRTSGTPLVPNRADYDQWAENWKEYLAGWKQAVVEDRESACRWETQA